MQDSLNSHFLMRKIHSLTGLIPAGVFLGFHLWENSLSRRDHQPEYGAGYYNEHVVHFINSINYIRLLEVGLLGLILYHAIYGVVVTLQSRPNSLRYRFAHNQGYLFQRITAAAVFAFITFHVLTTRFAGEQVGQDLFGHMATTLQNPIMMVIYLLGIVLASFHLGNGLWLMGITWGVTTHPRAQKLSFVLFMGLSAAIAAMGIHGLWGFNQRLF